MTQYKDYVFNAAVDKTLWNLAVREFGDGYKWTNFQVERPAGSGTFVTVTEAFAQSMRNGDKLRIPVNDAPVFDGLLTVTASDGVNVRDRANYTGNILYYDKDTKGWTFSYKTSSVTRDDAHRRVWVEVALYHPVNGYSSGWLPVSGPQDPVHNTGAIEDWVSPHIG